MQVSGATVLEKKLIAIGVTGLALAGFLFYRLVTWVDPEGKAAEAGLQPGDLVKEVNRNGVDSVEAFEGEMEKIKEEKTIQLLIMRARVGFLVVNINP